MGSEMCIRDRCIIFFLMLFLLGLDSEFALFETVLCAVFDAFPRLRFDCNRLKQALPIPVNVRLFFSTFRRQKVFVTAALVFVCFLLGLPCITQVTNQLQDISCRHMFCNFFGCNPKGSLQNKFSVKVGILSQGGGSDPIPTFSNQNHNHTKG